MEIVSPVNGSLACIKAVLDSGADAVYAGVRRASALRRLIHADNARSDLFSLDFNDLHDAVSLCHDCGKKIYIALNSNYTDANLKGSMKLLSALQSLKVDGVVVSDLGLVRLINTRFFGLTMHASIFTSPANAYTLELLKELNIKRVILEDRLSMEEIDRLKNASGLEIEAFAVTDTCFAYHGHCYISSYQFGSICMLPCHQRYSLAEEGSAAKVRNIYLGQGLSRISDRLLDLIKVNVDALKIEGRQRSTEDICNITSFVKRAVEDHKNAKTPAELSGGLEKINSKVSIACRENGGIGRYLSPKILLLAISYQVRRSWALLRVRTGLFL